MPIDRTCATDAVSRNISRMRDEGKPHAQSIAIALSVLKQSCGVDPKAKMTPKEIVAAGSKKESTGSFGSMFERFGIDFAVRSGTHGVGISPSAAPVDPMGTGRMQNYADGGEIKRAGIRKPGYGRRKKVVAVQEHSMVVEWGESSLSSVINDFMRTKIVEPVGELMKATFHSTVVTRINKATGLYMIDGEGTDRSDRPMKWHVVASFSPTDLDHAIHIVAEKTSAGRNDFKFDRWIGLSDDIKSTVASLSKWATS